MRTSVVRTSMARASAAGAPVIRRTVTGVGCAAAVLATVAACGTVQNLTAGQKVDNAVERLGEQKSLAFGMRLDADPEDLTALAGEDSEEVPPEMVEFLTGMRVDVSVKSKKPLADSGEKDIVGVGMKVSGDDGVLVEYRVVGGYTYFRSDMQAMGEAMGVPLPTADELDQLPESEQHLRPLFEGEWVKVHTSELEDATGDAGAGSGSHGSGELDAKTQKKVLDAVRGVVAREVSFKTKEGKDGAEVITAKANFRDLLTGVFDKLQPLKDGLPPGAELPTAKDLKDAPNKNVAVDFTIKNGDLTRIETDLAVLADDPKGAKAPLVLTFDKKAGDISAPKGATEMPVDKFGGPFGSGMLGV
ncbi:hypothetical protein [Streptomyces ipomoeae]|uniref:Uncharacterized protein n=1 Tax=Streptomyces ipomoeae 91-03 TaxID=698759 RepID=L1L1K1_9ACTN|nr:hypothetical protein [Streptomyces ipomoeae]EKX66951.1 hypothetical protein STRIP9103_05978 [Streptomyces ipomoeae 91-03]MDX2693398.1 hypothetical protein [Streptomyces ipomoeae]MDX2839256.1 hypothetical protein [Streptomyces ipomoeae]